MSKRQIIGMGERATFKLLKKHYGEQTFILTQVPLGDLLNDEFRESLSERQKKETIDIVVFRKKKPKLAVRVQDDHHKTKRMGQIDKAQEMVLHWSGVNVLDIWHYECPEIFKDRATDEAYLELIKSMELRGIL